MTAPTPLGGTVVSDVDVDAVLECYRSGWLTMGPRTKLLEEAFAARIGTRHAIAVGSASATLHLVLLGLQLEAGDEVLVSGLALGAAATTAIGACGGVAVACDVLGPEDHTLDPEDVAGRVTPRTRVLVADHRWGYSCDVGALRALCDERGIVLVEDCTQALGAVAVGAGREVGAAGRAACFSLSAEHQLPVGEGGIITTDDDDLAARARALRSHAMTSVTWDRHRGHAETYDVLDVGFNYRLDEPRAALALSRLPRLDAELDGRRAAVLAYHRALEGSPGVTLPWPGDARIAGSSPFAFGVLLHDLVGRERAAEALTGQAIATSDMGDRDDAATRRLPRCGEIAARGLRLPLRADLGAPVVERVAAVLQTAC